VWKDGRRLAIKTAYRRRARSTIKNKRAISSGTISVCTIFFRLGALET